MRAESASGQELRLHAAALSDRGLRREHNEDIVLVRDDLGLYLVADGAGGHNAGDVAAELATRSIANYFSSTLLEARQLPEFDRFGFATGARRLARAVQKANRDVIEISKTSHKHRGMGTTVVAAHFSSGSDLLHVAHVGDSRCYRLRAGNLELLTQDHSLLTDVLEQRPDIEDAVLARLPKHVVTRALGMDERLRVSMTSHAVVASDRYLLCSDGLSGPVLESALAETLVYPDPPHHVVQKLVALANAAGGPDNIAALVIDCVGEQGHALRSNAGAVRTSSGDDYDEDPELLILGIEELDPYEQPHTASDGLLKTVGELFKRGK